MAFKVVIPQPVVDEGVNFLKEKGCEVVVAGTAVFKANDRKQVIEGLLKL